MTAPLPIRALTALSALALLAACSAEPTAEEQRLLVVDGIEVRMADVDPIVRWLDSFRPDGGHKTKVMRALTEQVLPVRLARRAFPQQRQQLHEQAQALADIATNVYELDQHSAQMAARHRSTMDRMRAALPIAMALFDPERTGSVCGPIEVPTGWFVVGAFDLHEEKLAIGDKVDALQVAFVTHNRQEWDDWFTAEKLRIRDKVTFVHPDFRDSLPDWLLPPRTP